MLLHHAHRDQIVSFRHSLALHDEWRERVVDVRPYVTRGGVDHISGGVAATRVALDRLARRLARFGLRPVPRGSGEPQPRAAIRRAA